MLGLLRRKRHRASRLQAALNATFHPRRLFQGGQQGCVFEPVDPDSLLKRRNLLLATATMSTQSVTTQAVAHTLSFTGTGTVTLSGASTAGPLVGTGVSDRVTLTFTPTAASLTLTVTGSVTTAQLERGSAATLYQPITDWTTEFNAAVGNHAASFQDSTGITPVTGVETLGPVGRRLDSRFGLFRGPNLVSNGTFDNATTGWTARRSASISASGGCLRVTQGASASAGADIPITCVVGRTYELRFDYVATSSSLSCFVRVADVNMDSAAGPDFRIDNNPHAVGPRRGGFFVATQTTHYVFMQQVGGAAGNTSDFDNVEVREVLGNHALQATAASRPTYRKRYNLITFSDQMDNAAWAVADITYTTNQAADGAGNTTLDLLTEGTAGSAVHQQSFTIVTGAGVRGGLDLKRGNHDWVRVLLGSTDGTTAGIQTWINLSTGVLGTTATYGAATGARAWVENPASGVYRVFLEATSLPGVSSPFISTRSASADSSTTRVNNSTRYVGRVDVRYYEDALKYIPPYQRIGAATDYDTEGFPGYDALDGGDDSLVTAGGGGVASGFHMVACITVLGGAGAARTLWSDTGTNTGYRVRINTSNQLELAAGNGSAYTTVNTTATLALGGTYVVSAWDDGTVLGVQIDNGAVATTARPAVSAGTAAITIGKDNGAASSFFTGRLYGMVKMDVVIGQPNLARLKKWLAAQAGVVLV